MKPGSRYQPFVHQHNYVSIIDNLFPAFLCRLLLRSLKVIRHHPGFNLFLLCEVIRRRLMWPSFFSHLNNRLDFISRRETPGWSACGSLSNVEEGKNGAVSKISV